MRGKRPHIALLLSGLPRQWRHCLPSQLDLLKEYSVDVFFHFWDTIDAKEKTEIVDLLKPQAYRFEPPQDFLYMDTDPSIKPDLINVPSRMISQYYSWRAAASLVEPFKSEYDVGMRSWADLQFVYSLDHIIPKLKSDELVTTWWEKNSTFSDLFAVGGIEPILYFHALYDHVRDYAPALEFNSEILLTTHLKKRSDITVYAETTQFFFVRRPHMDNYTVEQAMLENPGRNKWLDPELVQAHALYHQKGEESAVYFKEFQRAQLHKLVDEVREKTKNDKP